MEESGAFDLFHRLPSPPTTEEEHTQMLQELGHIQVSLLNLCEKYKAHQQKLTRLEWCMSSLMLLQLRP